MSEKIKLVLKFISMYLKPKKHEAPTLHEGVSSLEDEPLQVKYHLEIKS